MTCLLLYHCSPGIKEIIGRNSVELLKVLGLVFVQFRRICVKIFVDAYHI